MFYLSNRLNPIHFVVAILIDGLGKEKLRMDLNQKDDFCFVMLVKFLLM